MNGKISATKAILIAVAVALAISIGGGVGVAWISGEVNETQKRSSENRLLFKFACALPLAVAERLDGLVQIRLEAGTLKPSEKGTFEKYHADYQRGKDICPPISKAESERIADLLVKLGGKLPDTEPGRRPMP